MVQSLQKEPCIFEARRAGIPSPCPCSRLRAGNRHKSPAFLQRSSSHFSRRARRRQNLSSSWPQKEGGGRTENLTIFYPCFCVGVASWQRVVARAGGPFHPACLLAESHAYASRGSLLFPSGTQGAPLLPSPCLPGGPHPRILHPVQPTSLSASSQHSRATRRPLARTHAQLSRIPGPAPFRSPFPSCAPGAALAGTPASGAAR